jgi:myo-inositol-1(or 4)-monophosphatase
MYEKIINRIVELGDSLPSLSGNTLDIGKTKRYLTEKDLEIETELTNLIHTFPGKHSVYAEELHDTFIEDENVWIIDPISNTINFIHGLPHYSVVLSHVCKGEIKFAIVYDPCLKELFTAEKGKGAFLNKKRVHVSTRTEDLFFLMNQSTSKKEKSLKITRKILEGGHTVRSLGSLGIHYAYVACGRTDVALAFNYDTFPEFAGKLLVEEAGGKFTDFKGNVLNHKTEGIIASNGLVHDEIKNMISDVV